MKDIEEIIYQNYEDNMEFLKAKHHDIYNRILALEILLQDGRYPQKYELEFNDGYFDVVDLKSGDKLYGQNSIEFSKKLCEEVTFRKNDQVFKGYRKLLVSDFDAKLMRKAPPYVSYSTIAEIINFYNKYNEDTMHLTQIEKYIFLGSALGLHIKNIVEKFDIQIILLIEDDIELFRLSLFVTNYKEFLEDRTIFFSINDSVSEFESVFSNFFKKAFFKNRYIKFTAISSTYDSKIDTIRSLLVTRTESAYSNERLLLKSSKIVENIKNRYKFLNIKKIKEENGLKEMSILALGAGPSLSYNREWVKKNRDRFIIIAPFSALKTLKKINISPDIVVHIDEREDATQKMIDDLEDLSFLENSLFFFTGSVAKSLIDQFDKDRIYFHEDRTRYKLSKSTIPTTSVGDTVLSLSMMLNAKEIYLLGLDMALGFEGESHSKEHISKTNIDEKESKEDNFQLNNQRLKIKGNLADKVETLPVFLMSIPIINQLIKQLKGKEQFIYNLSQNGVYFEGTIPTKIKEAKLPSKMDKKESFLLVKKLFDQNSSDQLNLEEYDMIFKREEQIEEFLNITDEFKNAPTTPKENFLQSFIDVVSKTMNHSFHYELWEILYMYGMLLGSYVDDLMFTKEVKLRKKELKQLKDIVYRKYTQQIDTYKEILNYLEKE